MTINKTKFDQYVDRLYKARIKRDKNGIKSTGKRIKPNEPQGIDVIRQCQEICVICNQKYSIKDHENFEIHHVDGDRANTDTKNLILICHLHHKQIHNKANSEFRNWVNTHQNKIKNTFNNKKNKNWIKSNHLATGFRKATLLAYRRKNNTSETMYQVM